MPAVQLVEFAEGLAFWAPDKKEAKWIYEEIFVEDCYADLDIPENAFVVDVGANIGMFTYLIRQQRPDCRVLAFEPMKETAEALRRNAERHGFFDITIEECALGERYEDNVEFIYYPNMPGNSTRYPDEKELQERVMSCIEPPEEVRLEHTGYPVRSEIRRLSSYLSANEPVDLVKVDVEGAELDVLRGIDIAHWPLIGQLVLEVQDLNDRLASIQKLLATHGFRSTVQPSPLLPEEILTFMVHATRG